MAERYTPPMGPQTAKIWQAHHGCSVGLRDVTVITKAQLTADDRDILHVGCGYGSLVVALYKCIRALTEDQTRIVGIDHCIPLLDEANISIELLQRASEDDGYDIAQTIKLQHMDVMEINSPQNLDMLRSHFPNGPKIIIAVGVFDDLANPAAQNAIRDLVALQPRGGRFILGSQSQPVCCGSAYLFERIRGQTRVVGILNLVPPECIRKPEEDTFHLVQNITGPSPIRVVEEEARSHTPLLYDDPPNRNNQGVSIDVSSCEFMGKVLEDFATARMLPNDPLSVRLGHEASFFHSRLPQQRIVNTSDPEIMYVDASDQFIIAVAQYLAPLEQGLQRRYVHDRPPYSIRDIENDMVAHAREYDGVENIRTFLCGYLHLDQACHSFDFICQAKEAIKVILNARDEVINAPFGGNWRWFQVQPLSVLTCFSKA